MIPANATHPSTGYANLVRLLSSQLPAVCLVYKNVILGSIPNGAGSLVRFLFLQSTPASIALAFSASQI